MKVVPRKRLKVLVLICDDRTVGSTNYPSLRQLRSRFLTTSFRWKSAAYFWNASRRGCNCVGRFTDRDFDDAVRLALRGLSSTARCHTTRFVSLSSLAMRYYRRQFRSIEADEFV
jgi:hypothetical protein